MIRRVIPLAFFAACTSRPTEPPTLPSHPIGNVTPPTTETVAAMLAREVGAGRSVALVAGSKGLRAISSDGARERVLAPSPAWFALLDDHDVVWYGVGKQIRAIDLAATAVKEHVVVDGIPGGGGMVGPANVRIYHGVDDPTLSPYEAATAGGVAELSGAVVFRTYEISISKTKVELSGSSGYEQSDEFDAAVKAAKIVDTDFAKTLFARPRHEVKTEDPTKEFHVPGIDPKDCEKPEDCGKAERLPGTHYAKVLVGSASGDIYHAWYKLYDLTSKRLIEGDWFASLATVSVAGDGSAMVSRGSVIRFEGGPLPATPLDDSVGGGFLDGHRAY